MFLLSIDEIWLTASHWSFFRFGKQSGNRLSVVECFENRLKEMGLLISLNFLSIYVMMASSLWVQLTPALKGKPNTFDMVLFINMQQFEMESCAWFLLSRKRSVKIRIFILKFDLEILTNSPTLGTFESFLKTHFWNCVCVRELDSLKNNALNWSDKYGNL